MFEERLLFAYGGAGAAEEFFVGPVAAAAGLAGDDEVEAGDERYVLSAGAGLGAPMVAYSIQELGSYNPALIILAVLVAASMLMAAQISACFSQRSIS